jgi:hypothetical protein
MGQAHDEITQNVSERLCWEVAPRDDSRGARRLYRKQGIDGVYRLDEGAVVDGQARQIQYLGRAQYNPNRDELFLRGVLIRWSHPHANIQVKETFCHIGKIEVVFVRSAHMKSRHEDALVDLLTETAQRYVDHQEAELGKPMLKREYFCGIARHFINTLVAFAADDAAPTEVMEVAWAESIRDQCLAAGVPLYVKQDSAWKDGLQGRLPDDLWSYKQLGN